MEELEVLIKPSSRGPRHSVPKTHHTTLEPSTKVLTNPEVNEGHT